MEPSQKRRKFWSPLSCLFAAIVLIILASLIIPAMCRARERARRISCLNHLCQIGLGIKQYSTDHGNWYPESGASTVASNLRLISNMVGNVGLVFTCPSDRLKTKCRDASSISDSNISYCYVAGLNDEAPIDRPLCIERGIGIATGMPLSNYAGKSWTSIAPHRTDGGTILFAGAHAGYFTMISDEAPKLSGTLARSVNVAGVTNRVLVPE
jgi:uncharacterized protein DUF1559